jgi:UTP--glucose-1-phosphate uridylyltransferase
MIATPSDDSTKALSGEVDALPREVLDKLARFHFDKARFLALSKRVSGSSAADNFVKGRLDAPGPEDIVDLKAPAASGAFRDKGLSLLAEGKSALVVLAGGMATRMGGVVKALVPAIEGKTFLELRLAERASLEKQVGRPVPLWLMTSAATDGAIRDALGPLVDGERTAVFPQRLSLRLTPDGGLFRDASGNVSDHAPGHGDLIDALKDSGLLQAFVARGGETISVANLDNLGATLDPAIIGLHVSHGKPVTCEVVDKLASDRGGIPVRHDGRTVVLEEFRIPQTFDPATVRVFNTNTFHFTARALSSLNIDWSYFVVTKKVDGKPAIQFERLVNEITSYLDSVYLRVPRSGAESRFLPVKDYDELAARKDELLAVARSRGMLG